MSAADSSILWTARVAFLFYVGALAAWLRGRFRLARSMWTAGLLVYLIHVAAAFQFRHHWSHAAAYEDTARQTAAQFGMWWGGGLYFNYVFTAVWIFDAIWLWRNGDAYGGRPRWITAAIQSFMAFMFFNAVVVFVTGPVRWLGLAAGVALGILALRRRRADGNEM
jgi:hypothetical protein